MLRLSFRSIKGDAPTLVVASHVRFCADGTLRGPDNYVLAHRVDGGWQISGKVHREFDCEGPVRLRLSMGTGTAPVHLGPFDHVRTASGVLYGNDACLDVWLPGRTLPPASTCHELTMLSEGPSSGKA